MGGQSNRLFIFSYGFFATLILLIVAQPVSARLSPLNMEPVELVPEGQSEFSAGIEFEKGRTMATQNISVGTGAAASDTTISLDYDNTRFQAMQLRMGLLDNFELDLGVDYSINSANQDNVNTPDESGLEGVSIGGKIGWHPNIATSFGVRFNGKNNIMPYGQDDPAFHVNVPLRVPFAGGMLNGQVGAKFLSGDVENRNGTVIGEWKNQFHGGIGYSYKANPIFDMNMELFGQSAPAEDASGGPNLDYESLLQLNFGGTVHMGSGIRMEPSVGFALLDGSPDFSIGLQYEIDLGKEHHPGREGLPSEERYSRKEPVGLPEVKKSKKQQEKEKQKEKTMEPTKKRPQKRTKAQKEQGLPAGIPAVPQTEAERLMKQGYQAAQRGNYNKAIRKYQQAADLDPKNLIIESNLGSLYYRQGNFDQALRHYKKAVQLNPNDEFSLLYLGATHYHLGNTDRARQYFRRVKNLNPQNQRVREWLKQLNGNQ